MKLKYVIIDESKPIVFGEYFQHSAFNNMGKITSAGFCSIKALPTDDKKYPNICSVYMVEVCCWGESVSLKIESNPEWDQSLIRRMYNN